VFAELSRLPVGRFVRSGLVLAAIAGALALDVTAALLVPVLFVLVVPFEKLFPRHRQRLRRPGLATDIAYGLTQPLLVPVGIAVALVVGVLSLAWLPGLAVRPLVDALPTGARTALGVVLFDLVSYWAHRCSHEVPLLWRFHAVHHSTVHLDWISGLRNHPVDGVLLAPPFVFLVAAGFSPELAGVLAVVQVVTGLFLHANVRCRWRPFHRVVITPEFHHWHHANEADAHNANYSILLPVWDLLFGTYFMPAGRRPSVYGVTPPLPDGLVEQLLAPLRHSTVPPLRQ
jgi:sterol desaturase/sphingolipid hydroxylase (fatty acid hydroxylase superfamily)